MERGVRVAVLAPMTSELQPVVRALGLAPAATADDPHRHAGRCGDAEVVATLTGIGTARAAAATERVLSGETPDHVLVVGIAGGLAHAVAIGDLVVPAVVEGAGGASFRPAAIGGANLPAPSGVLVTSDDFTVDPDRLATLRARGVVALDMETAAVAAVCERAGTRWSVVRAISDLADDHPLGPAALDLVGPDGRPDARAVARFVVRHPAKVPVLARLGRDASRAARTAAGAAAAACRALRSGNAAT